MIESMTGYGRGEATHNGITFSVEVRSVNNRFLEVTSRLPKTLAQRENEIKEIVRTKIQRGKIMVNASSLQETNNVLPIRIDTKAAKSVVKILNDLRKATKIKEAVKLEHVLRFSEIFETLDSEDTNEDEWLAFEKALVLSLSDLKTMRQKEGAELAKDLKARVLGIEQRLDEIEVISLQRIPEERVRLNERIALLVEDPKIISKERLELEIALLSDKLDVTEECVRFRSHNKFFLEALNNGDSAGRKLNFLIQEMNREANTIGSKINEITITHHVVAIKEELERIREQLQNLE